MPILSLLGARLRDNACASVFIAQNSTPWTPESTMRFTALPPPPPTPITYDGKIKNRKDELEVVTQCKGVCTLILQRLSVPSVARKGLGLAFTRESRE